MPIVFNLRHLEEKNIHLKGDLPVAELDIENLDEVIHPRQPLQYDLEVQKMEDAILVTGLLRLPLDCECVRCLKPFQDEIHLAGWACHLPLEGEDRVPINIDSVDLTPYLREDIVLAFPRHPLCGTECGGLKNSPKTAEPGGEQKSPATPSAWAELNKLKF